MYSYEDRIRAVRLYIKLGKSLAATVRQLGYPSATGTLERWQAADDGVGDHKKSSGVLREGTAVKYAWLDFQLHSYPVLALCEVLEVVSVSGTLQLPTSPQFSVNFNHQDYIVMR